MTYSIGIDFGTTNSVVAIASGNGHVESVQWPAAMPGPDGETLTETFRTALMFWQEGRPPAAKLHHVAGPQAIARAVAGHADQRFIQSIKTYVASSAFTEARLFGKKFTVEELVATFLTHLLHNPDGPALAQAQCVISGRPVVFAGLNANEALAVSRLRKAYGLAGFPSVDFAFEPLGAAYYYARGLQRDETVLVADFGGGTSDFSLMHFARHDNKTVAAALSHGGCPRAGDSFDYRLIDHLVAPQLGKGSQVRSFGKMLPLPAYLHSAFAQWHQLSFLKSAATMAEIRQLIAASTAPGQLEALADIIQQDLGFELHQAIAATKVALSGSETASLRFNAGGVQISAEVCRRDFEAWIAPDLAEIASAMEGTLKRANVEARHVDAVFLTGGSSYVPAVHRLFAQRFGEERIHVGHAFQSVARGLALYAADQARQRAA